MLEYVSRPSFKGLSKYWQNYIRRGFNSYFRKNWSKENISKIYTYLGNGINRKLCIKFISNNFNLDLLKRSNIMSDKKDKKNEPPSPPPPKARLIKEGIEEKDKQSKKDKELTKKQLQDQLSIELPKGTLQGCWFERVNYSAVVIFYTGKDNSQTNKIYIYHDFKKAKHDFKRIYEYIYKEIF